MTVFDAPGFADSDAPSVVLEAWNARVAAEFSSRPRSPILVDDPGDIPNGQLSSAVKWPGHPLEPLNCQGEDIAAELSDWGKAGRAELHNEYLEYGLVMRPDSNGRLRPKRLIATTELMEWWQTMAVHAPDFLISRITTMTNTTWTFESIFGRSISQWMNLGEATRAQEFIRIMAGNGRRAPPSNSINQDHMLFMAHPINGLDDLIYVVHFGSFPYSVFDGGGRRRARMDEIFHAEGVSYLFCRNADPAAAEGAYNQAFIIGTEASPKARNLAFANPLGMYMRTFSTGDVFYHDSPIPTGWTRWSRGSPDTPQRLEFGPSDAEDIFLDEATIGRGPDAVPISGYQIAKRIEVGPLVVVGMPRLIASTDFRNIPAKPADTIVCGTEQDDRCKDIAAFKEEFDNQNANVRTGTRGGPLG